MRSNENPEPTRASGSRPPERSPAGEARTGLQRVLALQGLAGNAAVVQMLRRAGHPWAQGPEPGSGPESGPGPEPEQHRHGAGCGHGPEQPSVQRSSVHDVLRTPGRPLDDATRTDMEARLGADFSDVRVHDDSAARASAAEVGARAYTSGGHVVIGEGGGDPHTLAHELTHVIQQRQGPVAGTDDGSGLKVSDPSDRFEREAEANAVRVMRATAPELAAEPATTDTAAPTHAGGAVQRMWNGNFGGGFDGDGDLSMGTQQSSFGDQSSQGTAFGSQATLGSQFSQQSASFPSLDLFNVNWSPHQLSRPRAGADLRQAQAQAMAELDTLIIPARHEGAQPSVPDGAAHPDAHVGDVETITVYRDAGWVPPQTSTRGGSLQTHYVATYHSAYFNYRISLTNDATSATHVNPDRVFPVLTQTPRSNGRGSQGRTYMFEHRWAPNPSFVAAPGQGAAETAAFFGLDPDLRLSPADTGFVPLPTDPSLPFVFFVEEDRSDSRFLNDKREFLSADAFDTEYAMASLTGSTREQERISQPPIHDRRTAGRSTSQAMGGTQAHEWVDAGGSQGGAPGVLAKYEWCHLIGDGDSGPNIPENLVIGTNAVNTEQLAMEIGLRRYVRQLDTRGYGIELRVRATMVDAPEHQNPDAPNILNGAPLMADWISYEITIVGPGQRHPVHRQIMDAARGTITESEFVFLQTAVEQRIRAFIQTRFGGPARGEDEAVVGADVEL
ncbi:DUF4157 domain-containing protein [Streptomyces sp. NPDC093795]|uniref:eCIS core domain-containing protein n=1 Tax=Streptomyces sp. NPDC093795 TaxID=3366051 RepID=UPI00380CF439